MTNSAKHVWRFFRAGGFDQVRIETGDDIAHLGELDQKLWVALACPTRGIHFDTKTLDLLDTDQDGRLRAPEILAGAQWACAMLKDLTPLAAGADILPLTAINVSTPEGRQLQESAKHILNSLGKPGAGAISVADTADTLKIFAGSRFNGDGVVTADSAADAETRQLIGEIIDCLGGVPDRGGLIGVDAAKLGQFFTAAQAYAGWWQAAEEQAGTVLPLGNGTAAAAAAYQAVRGKIDDYFARCRLAAFDARATAAVNRQEADYLAVAAQDMTLSAGEIAAFPLARIAAEQPLPLGRGLNPAWADRVAAFAAAIQPWLGSPDVLTFAEWTATRAKFAAFEAWQGAKAGAGVEKLGLERVRTILAGPGRAALEALIAEDLKKAPEAAAIVQVDKLTHLTRDLCRLLNNFVSFRDFYGRKDKAVFQAGTLYLDGRSCDLCVNVADAGKHAALAALAKTYLAYCDCTRPSGEKMQVAAAFTGGDCDNLMVGRNGVFYDRLGRDWDATISKIVDNPISIRQAFWAPYKKCLRMIEEQVAKRAAAADANATAKMQAKTEAVANVTPSPASQPPPPPVPPKKVDPGMLAAIGLVLATLLAALGGIFGAFAKLPTWQMPLAIIGIMLAISLPSMVIAWLKLRQRNLGPILDANGWAVNVRAKINVPFGGSLTKLAVLPPNSERAMSDPFAEKKPAWPWLLAILVILGVVFYVLYDRGYLCQRPAPAPPAVTVPAAPVPPAIPAKPAVPAK